MALVVIVNIASGPETVDVEALRDGFAAARVPIRLEALPPAGIDDRLRAAVARRPEGIVVGGGDGTISAAAGVLAGTGIPFGVLPLGTVNQFARTLGMPLDPREACRTVAAEAPRAVDLACVNERPYVNHAAVGLYPRMAFARRELRLKLGRGRLMATLGAIVRVFRRYPLVHVALEAAGRVVERTTPFVFVGNNPFDFRFLSAIHRPHLDTGRLGVYTTRRTGRLGLLGLMLRALFGRLEQARDFESWELPDIRIGSGKRRLRVVIDGEVRKLRPPLHFRALPGALRVLAPRAGGGEAIGPAAMAGGT